jgi:hypothetical protein
MIQLAIGGILLGAVFGLRCKVIVLLPLTILGGVIIGLAALLIGQSALVAVATFGLALQAGYLLGSLSRITMAAARAVRNVPARGSFKALR